ncbi:PLP-dependent transferase [Tilletiaria anomala UBC 951]|uniref:phosphoserine transaminase n=1 Tax=Tilletiaria anomala (strain ATCC 24038 / CBS 436.72 / UBC 951) TaxID=1037660 RepID=A0A066WFX9_TILAU|nr:PLP-dependent transferase [Tilletiaria anomala UBC 951]KDN52706.1 PLP-dependent transferase [Tilletiaria anomala UBC 951]
MAPSDRLVLRSFHCDSKTSTSVRHPAQGTWSLPVLGSSMSTQPAADRAPGAASMSTSSVTLDAGSRTRTINLGAGPSMLPTPVLFSASQALVDYQNLGMGVTEISHRSSTFQKIVEEAEQDLRQLLGISDEFAVFFTQGGGTEQFSAVALNLMARHMAKYPKYWQRQQASIAKAAAAATGADGPSQLRPCGPPADYAISGSWSAKASKEASRLGFDSRAVFDSRKDVEGSQGKFGAIPPVHTWRLSPISSTDDGVDAPPAFLYYCDNETVDGVEYNFPSNDTSDGGGKRGFPVDALPASYVANVPLVADMSSNILSRRIPHLSSHALIFFGAQKNVGPSGVTIVIVKRQFIVDPDEALRAAGLWSAPRIPTTLVYKNLLDNSSLYNTPPMFSIYVSGLVFKDLLQPAHGGVHGAEERSEQKAHAMYSLIDSSLVFVPTVRQKEVRSRMNVTFRLQRPPQSGGAAAGPDEQLEAAFVKACAAAGIVQVKGHRSVGGIRTSLYNAVTLEQTDKLVQVMRDFAAQVEAGKV